MPATHYADWTVYDTQRHCAVGVVSGSKSQARKQARDMFDKPGIARLIDPDHRPRGFESVDLTPQKRIPRKKKPDLGILE